MRRDTDGSGLVARLGVGRTRRQRAKRGRAAPTVPLALGLTTLLCLLNGCGFGSSQGNGNDPFAGSIVITVIASAPVVPSQVYLGTSAGLFVSPNNGQDWTALPQAPFAGTGIRSLAPSATERGTLWVITGAPLAQTTPTTTPTRTSSPTPSHGATATPDATPTSQPTLPATGQPGMSGAVWVSHDGGNTWHWASTHLPGPVAAVWPGTASANEAWATVAGDGLWLTTDDGLDWSAVGGLPAQAVAQAVLGTDSTGMNVLLGTNTGLLRSTDGGKHWSAIREVRGSVHALVSAPLAPSTIYCLTDFGLFRSTDGGAHFAGQSYGLPDTTLAVGVNPDVVYALAGIDVHRSADGGRTWKLVQTTTAAVAGIVTLLPASAFATPTVTATSGHAASSKNATPTATQIGPTETILVALSKPTGILFSRDGGQSWTQKGG